MLNVTNEILKMLKIKYAFLITEDGTNVFVSPKEIWATNWKVFCNAKNIKIKDKIGELNICFNDEIFVEKVSIEQTDKKNDDIYTLTFNRVLTERGRELKELIFSIEKKMDQWSRRQEPRYIIGIESSEELGLTQAEQKVLLNGKIYPACVLDVSLHGMKIITLNDEIINAAAEVVVALTTATETITVKTEVVYRKIEISASESKTEFLVLCTKLKDESPEYEALVNQYVKFQANSNKNI